MRETLRRRLRRAGVVALGAAALSLALYGAGRVTAELPARPEGAPSHAFATPLESGLGREVQREVELGEGESAYLLLATGADALAARIGMIDAAERAIDFQYYMLNRDAAGELVVRRLLSAADRGVRVRMLLDDFGSGGLDGWMPEVSAHENVEVRYFNPFARGPLGAVNRLSDLVARMALLDHRMHNKLLAVDGTAAVVGGRNVGDEYYGLGRDMNFADADLLVVGEVLGALGADFDAYWNSEMVCDVRHWERLERDAGDLEALRERLRTSAADSHAEEAGAELLAELESGARGWTVAEMYAGADAPQKALAPEGAEHLIDRIRRAMGVAEQELLIVSPYFIPGEDGTAELARLAGSGVRVAVLTNSLAATDVAAVHSGYSKYRRALLEGGVELYELKPFNDDQRFNPLAGSSGASLHAKSTCQDRSRVFVGSLNLDPRSVLLNTEQGVVVHSEVLAGEFLEEFGQGISPENSWRVLLDGGALAWESLEEGELVRVDSEPDAGVARRWTVRVMGWLPLEGRL